MATPSSERNTSEAYNEFQAQLDEIRKHKWIESQQSGIDIGFERALTEWMSTHGQCWRDGKRTEKKNGK